MAWMRSRPSGWLPDGLDELQSHRDGFPMALELIQAIGKPSRRPRALPDGLDELQAVGKPSQRPGGATVRALQKMLRALWKDRKKNIFFLSNIRQILEYSTNRYSRVPKNPSNTAVLCLAQDLVEILEPFYEFTLQMSLKASARVPDVVVLVHSLYEDEYFKLAKWPESWIDEAIDLTREMYDTWYKPRKPTSAPKSSRKGPSKPQTGVLAGLGAAAMARSADVISDPIDIWLTGGLILDEGAPINGLKWWIEQKKAGNTHSGLLQMALDVMCCPATTVNVERTFNFGRDYVSARRHNLSANAHIKGLEGLCLPNLKVEFLPPNLTSVLQPCDAGMIRAFKANYRRQALESAMTRYEDNPNVDATAVFNMNQLEAMHLAREAWHSVTQKTIVNCWRHTGIIQRPETETKTTDKTPVLKGLIACDNDLEKIVEQTKESLNKLSGIQSCQNHQRNHVFD
ncbi:hypothetical protein PSTT_16361 [Puccinia striiformis]|uniref:HAT C-terminal dimerisation domain-containing protein n=1 Tax=Puccinia striiformis TaxID=27350 RepID=A0A2S4UD81_9BASI|nr:hypothetical protein PSTT_16361 [Puccinia striiformis]